MGQTRPKRSKGALKASQSTPIDTEKKLEDVHPDDNLKSNPTANCQATIPELNLQHRSTSKSEVLKPDPTCIDVRNTELKGLAVFAARKIPAGTLILAEKPLIRLTQVEEDADKSTTSNDKDLALVTQFYSLPKPTQKSYLALYDSEKSSFSRIKSIYYSNCYNLSGANRPFKSSPGGSCIGLTASRINHSCLPNVLFSFDEARNLMLFHAVRAIPKGREVVSNYDSVYELRGQRQKRQMLYYGFRCSCEACEPDGSEFWMRSDERRRGMIEARREVRESERWFEEEGKLGPGQDPMSVLERLEGLLVKEGLVGLPLADTYKGLVKWAERSGDWNAVRKWRSKELEVCVFCLGGRAVRVEELRNKLDLVK